MMFISLLLDELMKKLLGEQLRMTPMDHLIIRDPICNKQLVVNHSVLIVKKV